MVYSRFSFMDEKGKDTSVDEFNTGGNGIPGIPTYFFSTLIKENVISVITCTVRKSVFQECGLFTESIRLYEDWLMWLKLTFAHKVFFINESLAKYRQHPESAMHKLRRAETELEPEISSRRILSDLLEYPYYRKGSISVSLCKVSG